MAPIEIYRHAVGLSRSVRDPIDFTALSAIDLDAIGPKRAGRPTDPDGGWTPEELRRWHAESHLRVLRRRTLRAASRLLAARCGTKL